MRSIGIIVLLALVLNVSCENNSSKSIAFSGVVSFNTDNTVTLTAENGEKGIFRKDDITSEMPQVAPNSDAALQIKIGSEVIIGGKKLIVGTDLLDPNSEKAKKSLRCDCEVSCGGGGSGKCCAVSGYKMKCVNGICQYTMEACSG